LGLSKILWHQRIDYAQLGILVKQAHILLQEIGDVVRGHVWDSGCVFTHVIMNRGRRPAIVRVASVTVEFATIHFLLATIFDMVSSILTVKALVIVHEFFLLGFRVLYSSASANGINIHMMPSLRGGVKFVFEVVLSSFVTEVVSVVGVDSKGPIYGLFPVAVVLFSSHPLEVLLAGFFFPILEFPRVTVSWVIVRGSDDHLDEWSL